MALYLQLNGTSDDIITPSITFNQIVLDLYAKENDTGVQYIYHVASGSAYLYSGGDPDWFVGSLKIDGVQITNGSSFIAPNRALYDSKIGSSTITESVCFFRRSTGIQRMPADVFSIKIYNNNNLVAHYNMSTGTVQDQSGNGNHATLTGGTWLDDGTGGTPTGTDGSSLLSLSQVIYSDEILPLNTKQLLYSDELLLNLTNQTIYSDNYVSYYSNQTLYQDDVAYFDSKQVIYEDSFIPFATLQEIFNDGQIGSIVYPILLKMYSDTSIQSNTKQIYYEDALGQYGTYQSIYENNQTLNSTKQIIYSDSINNYPTHQKIYSDNQSEYKTKQSIYENQFVILSTLQQLFEHSSMDLQTKQSIYQLDTLELLTLQSIYEDNSMNMNTLQQFLSDYVEYRQVFKYLLEINQSMKYDLQINGKQVFSMNMSSQVSKFDLNI